MKRALLIISAFLLSSYAVFWAGNRYILVDQQLYVGNLSAATLDTGMINMCKNQTGQVHAFLSNTAADGMSEIWGNTDRNNAAALGWGSSGVDNTARADAMYMRGTSTQKHIHFILNSSTAVFRWFGADNGSSIIMQLFPNGNLVIGNGLPDAGANKFLQIGKAGVPLGTTQGTKMLLYYDTAGVNANVVGRMSFSDLGTILGTNYILNQTAADETKNIRLNGFVVTNRSNANTALSGASAPGTGINANFVALNNVTNGSGGTTNNTNMGFYTGLFVTGVPNMTSASGYGNFGFVGQLGISNSTFLSTSMVPAAIGANTSISNTTAPSLAAIATVSSFTGTNSITNYFQFYAPALLGSGTKPTNLFGFYQEDAAATNQFVGKTILTNYYSNAPAPSIAAGTGAGTSPSVSISGTNARTKITLTPGTSTAASSVIATITFSGSFAYPSDCKPVISPGNEAAAALSGTTAVYGMGSTNSFTIHSNTTALPAGTYIWYVSTGN